MRSTIWAGVAVLLATLSLHVASATPRYGLMVYGNWGGKDWSAGRNSSDGLKMEDFRVLGVDSMDDLFKFHDSNYDRVEKAYNAALRNADAILGHAMRSHLRARTEKQKKQAKIEADLAPRRVLLARGIALLVKIVAIEEADKVLIKGLERLGDNPNLWSRPPEECTGNSVENAEEFRLTALTFFMNKLPLGNGLLANATGAATAGAGKGGRAVIRVTSDRVTEVTRAGAAAAKTVVKIVIILQASANAPATTPVYNNSTRVEEAGRTMTLRAPANAPATPLAANNSTRVAAAPPRAASRPAASPNSNKRGRK